MRSPKCSDTLATSLPCVLTPNGRALRKSINTKKQPTNSQTSIRLSFHLHQSSSLEVPSLFLRKRRNMCEAGASRAETFHLISDSFAAIASADGFPAHLLTLKNN